jgi:hypothetical protein
MGFIGRTAAMKSVFGAMRVGEWKERAKWNEIIYRRGGIVQGGDGDNGRRSQ